MHIVLENESQLELPCDYEAIIKRVTDYALEYIKCPYEAQVNVLITDMESICQINKEYRQIDKPTDVLSFPMIDYWQPGDFSHVEEHEESYFDFETKELLLGDIILCSEKVLEQAEAYGHSVERELAFLTAHSMLHLFGYDHVTPKEEKEMFSKQEEILQYLGITR